MEPHWSLKRVIEAYRAHAVKLRKEARHCTQMIKILEEGMEAPDDDGLDAASLQDAGVSDGGPSARS